MIHTSGPTRLPKSTAAALVAIILALQSVLLAQGSESPVSLASAPTGTTNQTNPEIRVVAPDKVSYRYSLNGAPYSPERPIVTPIRLTGTVDVGGVPFTAGSSALVEFLQLRSSNAEFTDFLDRISFDHLESNLQVTYTLNKMRAAVLPENVVNLEGAGVADLSVTLQEKVAVGPRFEQRARDRWWNTLAPVQLHKRSTVHNAAAKNCARDRADAAREQQSDAHRR